MTGELKSIKINSEVKKKIRLSKEKIYLFFLYRTDDCLF